jgi:hypothetical protein
MARLLPRVLCLLIDHTRPSLYDANGARQGFQLAPARYQRSDELHFAHFEPCCCIVYEPALAEELQLVLGNLPAAPASRAVR